MTHPLYERYGYCEIPKGVELFRRFDHRTVSDQMFFGMQWDSCNSNNNPMMLWRTVRRFQVLLMVSHVRREGHAISSINEVYNHYFPNRDISQFGCMTIKRDLLQERQELIQAFRSDGIFGWITSLHDTADSELYLFSNENHKYVEYIQDIGDLQKPSYYYKNALKRIKVSPSNELISRTKADPIYERNNYLMHKAWVNSAIKTDMESEGWTKAQAAEYWLNLRIKMRV